MLALTGIQFTHILDFMIMMPLGPQLIRVLQIDTHDFGLLLSSYTFAAAASGVLAASYLDRFERRSLLLWLYSLFTIATLCCGLAPDFTSLLVARALAGIFGGMLGALVQTMIADAIPFERRGRAMGMVMMSFSISTVAGVPLGLLLADGLPMFGWRAPFFFIVLLGAAVLLLAWKVLPRMSAHLGREREGNALQQMIAVARHPEHLKAFVFISLTMFQSFMVIPYIALYMTANVGISESYIPLIYLCGGTATLFSSQWIGHLADRHGKPRVFRLVAIGSFVPLLITTHLVPVPLWVVLINATCFFVLISGRMIPGMAMVGAVASPQVRGSFMSLISSVQMLAGGLATLLAGMIITHNAAGQIEHYNTVGYLALGCGIATVWLARRLRVGA